MMPSYEQPLAVYTDANVTKQSRGSTMHRTAHKTKKMNKAQHNYEAIEKKQ